MVKKVRVSLHGFQNRGIMVDADATDGARVGKNLYWPDGSVVTEEELRSIQTAAQQSGQYSQNLDKIISYLLANVGTGGGATTDWPLHKDALDDGALTIPDKYQYLIWQEFTANGTLTIEAGGELVIFDEGLPPLRGPDFTFTAGDLTDIAYNDGSTKQLTYTSGNLSRVDLTRDGWTLRKDIYYDVNDDIDYIDEYYV